MSYYVIATNWAGLVEQVESDGFDFSDDNNFVFSDGNNFQFSDQ